MAKELKRFAEGELSLTREESYAILRFFFGDDFSVPAGQMTAKDRSFAQAILLEALDATYAMGYVEIIWEQFRFPRVDKSVASIVTSFAKKAGKHWFKHATQDQLRDPKIYESVRLQIRRAWRSEVKIRVQTGEYVAY
jgi:hypothetical protein